MIYRTETAAKITSPGDPEAPPLPKQKPLHDAVHEYLDSKFLDKKSVRALPKAKRTILINFIHNIG